MTLTAYTAFYANGVREELLAFDFDGAKFMAANLSALYGRGGVDAVVLKGTEVTA